MRTVAAILLLAYGRALADEVPVMDFPEKPGKTEQIVLRAPDGDLKLGLWTEEQLAIKHAQDRYNLRADLNLAVNRLNESNKRMTECEDSKASSGFSPISFGVGLAVGVTLGAYFTFQALRRIDQ